MPKTHFQPAPAGLTPDQLRDYQERERHANNAVAIASSAGTAPSLESLALMQRHVNGELSIEQVIELTDVMLKVRYAPRPPGLEDIGAMLQSPEFQERFEDVVSGTARRNNSYIVYVDAQKRTVREYPATEEIFEMNADRTRQCWPWLKVWSKCYMTSNLLIRALISPSHATTF